MMKVKETMRDKIVRNFFGVTGGLDEYKRKETDRIGNNVMIMSYAFLILSPLVAGMVAINYPKEALWGLILADLLFVLLVASPYIIFSARKGRINDRAVSPNGYKEAVGKSLRHAILSGVFFGIFMHFADGLINFLYGAHDFSTYLLATSSIERSAFLALIFGVLVGFYEISKIKKHE